MKKNLFLIIIISLLAFTFTGNPPSNGWNQQFMPDLNGQPISDIDFIDSLTGYAVTGRRTPNETNYILKTTNGGDNWSIIRSELRDYSRVIFLNKDTGFVSGGLNQTSTIVYKTTNGGVNWNNLNPPFTLYWDDMAVLNEDSIYLVDRNGFDGGVYRTTNGGNNWSLLMNFGGVNPNKIYMYDGNLGFISNSSTFFKRTTNGGINWVDIDSVGGFSDMEFINSTTGWKAFGNVMKTTNGGNNWISQNLPLLNWLNIAEKIKIISSDTLWAVGGVIQWIPSTSNFRGVIYKTVNGGNNWGYQIPDTGINYYKFTNIDFVNGAHGWIYLPNNFGFNTTVGGNGTTFYTYLQNINGEIPESFLLYQNYPNPFNPNTSISYQLRSSGDVKLIIYDITGKLIKELVNEHQFPGVYQYNFTAEGLASGIYFYTIQINHKGGNFIDTKKMALIK